MAVAVAVAVAPVAGPVGRTGVAGGRAGPAHQGGSPGALRPSRDGQLQGASRIELALQTQCTQQQKGGDREREERGDAAAHFFFSKKKNTKKAYLEEDGVADWPVVAVDPAGAYQVGALGQLRQAVVGRLDDPGGGDNLEPGVAGGGGGGK